jgi:hypothetical protein
LPGRAIEIQQAPETMTGSFEVSQGFAGPAGHPGCCRLQSASS